MTDIILREKEIKGRDGKATGTSRVTVDPEKLWEGWTTPSGVIIPGLKTRAKPARQAELERWGYTPGDIDKLKGAGLDV